MKDNKFISLKYESCGKARNKIAQKSEKFVWGGVEKYGRREWHNIGIKKNDKKIVYEDFVIIS